MASDDVVWLEVLPSMKGFFPNLSSGLAKVVGPAGKRAGQDLGDAMAQGMETGLEKARVAAERTEKSVEDISKAAKTAGQKQEESVRKVAIAQAKLDQAKQNSKSTQDKILKAENDLIIAQQKSEDSQEAALRLSKQLEKAKEAQVKATKALADEEAKANKASQKSVLKRSPKQMASDGVGAARKATALATAGVAAGGTSLLGIGKQFFNLGSQLNNIKTQIATNTGESGKDLDRLAASAQSLQSRMSGSSEEITDSMLAVRSSIKGMSTASSKDLQDTTVVADGFARSFGVDVERAAQVAGQMITTGMAKNGVQAFDLLTAAAQKVPTALREDLLDAVDEYGPAFKQVGISGDQMMSMLAKSSEKGMYGLDKTGDAVKELGIRMTTQDANAMAATDAINKFGKVGKLSYDKLAQSFAKGGPEGQKAFGTIVKGLQSIKDPAKRASAAMNMFGTPLEDLNAADIPKFLDSMSATSSSLGNVSGAAKRNADNIHSGPQFAMQNLTKSLQTMFLPISQKVFDLVNKGATWMISVGTPAIKKFAAEWEKGTGIGGRYRDMSAGLFAVIKSGTGFLLDHKKATIGVAVVLGGLIGTVRMINLGVAAYKATMGAASAVAKAAALAHQGLNAAVAGGKWVWATAQMAAHKTATLASAAASRGATLAERGLNAAVAGGRWVWATAQMLAHKAASMAVSIASKAVAAGQWLVNAAMSANPIGLVVGLLVALGAAFVIAYKKSATFRAIVQGAWHGIQVVAKAVWSFLLSYVIKPMWRYFTVILPAAFRMMGSWFSSIFRGAKSISSSVWSFMRDRVLNPIKHMFTTTLPNAFGKFGNKFRDLWNGMKSLAAKPVNFLINTVWNRGLRPMLNKIPGVNLGEVKPIAGYRNGGFTGRGADDEWAGGVHRNEFVMDAPTVRAAGGASRMEQVRSVLRSGAWPVGPLGERMGNNNQNASSSLPIPSSATLGIPGNIKDIIRRGPQPGDVGIGGPGEDAVQWGMGRIGSREWYRLCLAFVNRAWGRRIAGLNKATARESMNSVPRRMDGTPPPGAAVYWDTGGSAGHVALSVGDGTELSNDIMAPGLISRVPASLFASKWHAKYMGWYSPNGAQPGADSSWLSKLKGFIGSAVSGASDLFSGLWSSITGGISSLKAKATKGLTGPWGKLLKGVPSFFLDKASSWAKSKLDSLLGGGSAGANGNAESWRALVRQALAATRIGGGVGDENLWLKQIMTESSGNPNEVQSSSVYDINIAHGDPARGLVQVPGVTWADFGRDLGPFLPNVYNPLKNLIVGMRAAAAQHRNWRAVVGHGHGYEHGTSFAAPGWAELGEHNSMELVVGSQFRQMQGGEKVYSGAATRRLLGGSGPQEMVITGGRVGITEDGMMTFYNVAVEAAEDVDAKNARVGR